MLRRIEVTLQPNDRTYGLEYLDRAPVVLFEDQFFFGPREGTAFRSLFPTQVWQYVSFGNMIRKLGPQLLGRSFARSSGVARLFRYSAVGVNCSDRLIVGGGRLFSLFDLIHRFHRYQNVLYLLSGFFSPLFFQPTNDFHFYPGCLFVLVGSTLDKFSSFSVGFFFQPKGVFFFRLFPIILCKKMHKKCHI